jgi:hypothetical protein
MSVTFLLAHGAHNTLIDFPGSDYDGISFGEILDRVRTPTAVDKNAADFVIPSTYRGNDGRAHDVQRQRGSYRMLAVDIDKGHPAKTDVVAAIHEILGRCSLVVYSSASATKAEPKWRALIPLKQPISGSDYEDIQAALFDLLAEKGITCDGALARCGQPVFLPNIPPDRRKPDGQPAFYDYAIIKHTTFDVEGSRLEVEVHSRREQERLAAEAATAERQAREQERAQRRIDRPGDVDPMVEFNDRHSVSDLLLRYGYERRGSSSHYRSPHQSSGSFATRDYGTHWVSLSSSDAAAGIGRSKTLGKTSYVWGDAFDLYTHYEHKNDLKAAIRSYAGELRALSALPPPAPPTDTLDDFDVVPPRQGAIIPPYSDTRTDGRAQSTGENFAPVGTKFDPISTHATPPEDDPFSEHIPIGDPPPEQVDWPTPQDIFDATTIPRRQWIYGYDYIRQYVSVLASAGGIGKTSLISVEAISIITGRKLLGTAVRQQTKVWIINLEDPVAEMHMRNIAVMKHYGIKPEEVRGKLFVDGEDTFELTLAAETRDGLIKNDAMLDAMIARIKRLEIGVVIFDPFVSTHLVNENSNGSIQAVVSMMRRLARETSASVMIVHHVRKGNGDDASIDSVRGAGSLIGAARAARVINRVSEEDALKLGVDEADARSIFRVDEGKTNLAPPAHAAVYRRMIGVEIENGEWIGVCVPYELPNAFEGMSAKDARAVQDEVQKAFDDGNPLKDSPRSPDWVGVKIAELLQLDLDDKSAKGRVNNIVREWKKTGVLKVENVHDARRGREISIIVVGERVRLGDL